jgi:hypothetical protein
MSLKDSFDKTNLDVENPNVTGGPNRSNSSNIPGGIYNVPRSGTTFGNSPGGPLKNLKGEIEKYQLHQYTSKNTYLDSINPNNS